MKLGQIYKTAIAKGIAVDPRGKKEVTLALKRVKEDYEDLKKDLKSEFDKEKLSNPYADSRVLYGSLQTEVKRILVGIDMEVGEVLLADRLGRKNKKIDLIMAHHPEGSALAGLYSVMNMQSEILHKFGVPINVAESLMSSRIGEVRRGLLPINHTRAVDAARVLDIPFMNIHTPADNCVTDHLQTLIDTKKPALVGDVVKLLKHIPEYKDAVSNNAGPTIVAGHDKRKAGKVFVEMTGGTEGSKDVFDKISAAGVGTLICMHLSEDRIKKAKAAHINVIIAGHIASDNIGVNIILDELQKKDRKLEIIPCSGFRRVKRS